VKNWGDERVTMEGGKERWRCFATLGRFTAAC